MDKDVVKRCTKKQREDFDQGIDVFRVFWLVVGAIFSISRIVIQSMCLFGYRYPICVLSSSSFTYFLSSQTLEIGPTLQGGWKRIHLSTTKLLQVLCMKSVQLMLCKIFLHFRLLRSSFRNLLKGVMQPIVFKRILSLLQLLPRKESLLRNLMKGVRQPMVFQSNLSLLQLMAILQWKVSFFVLAFCSLLNNNN